MPIEIERKFLLASDAWRQEVQRATRMRQGYLAGESGRTVRVRVKGEGVGGRGYLTIKGRSDPEGLARAEFEYEIPLGDAEAMLASLCVWPVVEKTRHDVPAKGGSAGTGALMWEVDVFSGANEGLIVAEIELPTEDAAFEKPEWLGEEVTRDPRYRNSALARKPFTTW